MSTGTLTSTAVTHGPSRPTGPVSVVRHGTSDPSWVRWGLIGVTIAFLSVTLLLPIVVVFAEALRRGLGVYWAGIISQETFSAIGMTLLTVVIAVPANLIFGLAAAWAIAKFEFRGKSVLVALIDLPLAVSPVVSGLIFVLMFGTRGWFGPWLEAHHINIVFAAPGVVLATIFVTFPYVAHELIPLMEQQGSEEEEAAISLGASGLQTFFRVTLPNIKWALLYGVILCNARAMGEFGAVAVVAGSSSRTNTLPLEIQTLYDSTGDLHAQSFAVASLLVLLAVVTLVARTLVEGRVERRARLVALDNAPPLEPTKAEAIL